MKKYPLVFGLVLVLCLASLANAATVLFVSDQANSTILKYDLATGASLGTLATLAGGSSPTDIVLSPDQSVLYVRTASSIEKYNPATGAFMGTLYTGATRGMTVGLDGTVYATGIGADARVLSQISAAGVASAYWTFTYSTKQGKTNHNLNVLTTDATGRILAYSDPDNSDTIGWTNGTSGGESHFYMDNSYASSGLAVTATRFYYVHLGGLNKLCSLTLADGSGYQGGAQPGSVTLDAASGAVVTNPLDGLAYYIDLTGKQIRKVTADNGTLAGWATASVLTDASLGQAYGLAFYNAVDAPEPATMSLLAIGGIAALVRRRKK